MNAGTDYQKAKRQAQANANRSGQSWQMWIYNGVWWVERLGTSGRGETTGKVDDSEVIPPQPVCPNCGQWINPGAGNMPTDCLNECHKRGFA